MDSRCTCRFQTLSSFGPLKIEVDNSNHAVFVTHETEDFYNRFSQALISGDLVSVGEDLSQTKFYLLSAEEKAWLEWNRPVVRKAVFRIYHSLYGK